LTYNSLKETEDAGCRRVELYLK